VTTPELMETSGRAPETVRFIEPYPPEVVKADDEAAIPAVVEIFDPPEMEIGTFTCVVAEEVSVFEPEAFVAVIATLMKYELSPETMVYESEVALVIAAYVPSTVCDRTQR
jgi:hypothetical protein